MTRHHLRCRVDSRPPQGRPPLEQVQPSQRTLTWNRVRELGVAIVASGDPARIVEQAGELVDVLRDLEEWDHGPGSMRPIPMVALNDKQVALIYSLVLLALVQKTGSTSGPARRASVPRRAGPLAGVHR